MVSRSTVQQPTNPTPSSSQKLLPFQSQAPVVDRGVMALAEPVAVESRTPVEPVAVEMAETPSLSVPSTNCTAAMAQVGKPIRDWTEEDVAVFLMQLSSVPMDIIDVVHTHAISGAVLLSLTDEDLESLNIEKFGHRRLLLLAAQELRRAVQAERPGDFTGMLSPSSSLGSGTFSVHPSRRRGYPMAPVLGVQSVPVAPNGIPRTGFVMRSWVPQAPGVPTMMPPHMAAQVLRKPS